MFQFLKSLCWLLCLLFLSPLALAQRAILPIEPSTAHVDAVNGTQHISWFGKAGRTYFLQHSDDLVTWNFLPMIESGNDEPLEWACPAPGIEEKRFLRLVYTNQTASNPLLADFDGDGADNITELANDPPSDPFAFSTAGDGISDSYKVTHGLNPVEIGVASSDPDGDHLTNLQEYLANTDPNNADDIDTDGLPDDWEMFYAGNLTSLNATSDLNTDGLSDTLAFEFYGNPLLADTDGDGFNDAYEQANSTSLTSSNVPYDTVILSEVSAQNQKKVVVNGTSPDWVELYNASYDAVSMTGWTLVSQNSNGSDFTYTFPSGSTIAARSYALVLFDNTTGHDVTVSTEHPFVCYSGLSSSGEFLKLTSPSGLVSAILPGYPQVREDQTFGLDSAKGIYGFCQEATPGAANSDVHRYLPGLGFSDGEGRIYASESEAQSSSTAYRTTNRSALHAFGLITTDGSAPVPGNNTAMSLSQTQADYVAPAGHTAIFRARSWKDATLGSVEHFRSLILPEDVLLQSTVSEAYPFQWDTEQPWCYQMSPDIIDTLGASTVATSLRSLPTVSLQLNPDDLFGPLGIMADPGGRGPDWRRPTTFELLDPSLTNQKVASSLATLEIHGGSSRNLGTTQKLSFELKFNRPESGKLEATIFPDPAQPGGTHNHAKFSKLLLTNPTHDSWALDQSPNDDDWGWLREHSTYVKDAWASATERAQGLTTPRRKWVHLYLNGIYWGVYELREDLNADFLADNSPAASGGLPKATDDDYDLIKDDVVQSGTNLAWLELINALKNLAKVDANTDPAIAAANYNAVAAQLDLSAFADYMILNVFMGNQDWPIHNWIAYRTNRLVAGADGDMKFRFRCWDAQWTFLPEGADPNQPAPDPDSTATSWDSAKGQFAGPGYAFYALSRTTAFSQLLSDRFTALRASNSILGDTPSALRFQQQAALFAPGVRAEYARWGGWKDSPSSLFPTQRPNQRITNVEGIANGTVLPPTPRDPVVNGGGGEPPTPPGPPPPGPPAGPGDAPTHIAETPGTPADVFAITAVEFSNSLDILRYSGHQKAYEKPQWLDSDRDGVILLDKGERAYPIAYVSGSLPAIKIKYWLRELKDSEGRLYKCTLKITSSEPSLGIDFTTKVTPGLDKEITIPINGAWPERIKFYDKDGSAASYPAFSLNFNFHAVAPSGSGSVSASPSTRHTVYLVKNSPNSTALLTAYETVYRIGCKRAHNAPKDMPDISVVDAIFTEFNTEISKFRVNDITCRYDNTPMKYWENNQGHDKQGKGIVKTAGLLENNNGQCGSWAQFFAHSLNIQGISATRNRVESIYLNDIPDIEHGGRFNGGFLIKNWEFISPGTAPPSANPNPPAGFTHRWLTETNEADSIDGQSNNDPPQNFFNHFLVEHSGRYFDPSYGKGPFETPSSWEDEALSGFIRIVVTGNDLEGNPIGYIAAKPNSLEIQEISLLPQP